MDHTVLPAITSMPAFTSSAFTRWYLPRLRLRISNCSLLLIYLPRKDERLIRPDWLTYSGWFTHVSGHPPAAGGAQDRESSPVKDRCSTTVPRNPGRLWKTSIWLVGWLVRCLVGDGKFFPVVHPVDAQFAISEFNIITAATSPQVKVMVRTGLFEAGGYDVDVVGLPTAAAYRQLTTSVVRLTEVLTTKWTSSTSSRSHTRRYTYRIYSTLFISYITT